MSLFTERHGIREPIEKTDLINREAYYLLLENCEKYKNNLISLFSKKSYDNFTGREYIVFNEDAYNSKIKIRIPNLFRNEADIISAPKLGDYYEGYPLLDLIEYFSQNIRDINEYWNSIKFQNYRIIECFDTSDIFLKFKQEINEIFTESGLLYKLTNEKNIERIVENSILTKEMEKDFETIKEPGLKDLLRDAIDLYKTPNPSARQDSVEKLWDAFERMKTYYKTLNKAQSAERITRDMAHRQSHLFELFDKEFKELTNIGNKYRIRHHETNTFEIIDEHYYDYFFNRCLSLIALSIKYLE